MEKAELAAKKQYEEATLARHKAELEFKLQRKAFKKSVSDASKKLLIADKARAVAMAEYRKAKQSLMITQDTIQIAENSKAGK